MCELMLTICSVSFHSKPFLDLNWHLTTRLNPGDSFTWLVVENSWESCEGRLDDSDNRFHVVRGVEHEKRDKYTASYHHGAGLNKGLLHVESRFALFLDPDFYIVRKQWIRDVIAYMLAKDLSFFGVPWHPKWFTKVRHFPCPHCLFVDLDKVSGEGLDFVPELREGLKQQTHLPAIEGRTITRVRQAVRLVARNVHVRMPFLKDLHLPTLEERRSIGSSLDTGYRIYRQYCQDSQLRHKCAIPVFRPDSDFVGPKHALSRLNRMVERLLPDRLCFIPKQSTYYTPVSFQDLGYFDMRPEQWEEFMWQGIPFGFHLRSYPYRNKRDKAIELLALERAIRNLCYD